MYDSSMKYKWDNKNVLDYAVREAVQEAVKVATKEADAKAREEERKKVFEERKATAREMIKDGLPLAQISKFTKLSIEEIENL